MTETLKREAIFISHATPADNPFVRWLGAKLTANGYEVWADIFQLRGGQDWSRKLEEALRHKARKMLLVCTPTGLERQGVRNEIEIAARISSTINDPEFIIPLRLEPFDPPFRIAQLQYVDFKSGWAAGLQEVMELLATVPDLRRSPQAEMTPWLEAQRMGATRTTTRPETLMSNWLNMSRLPARVHYCQPPVGFDLSAFQKTCATAWPAVAFREGVLTFAKPDSAGLVAPGLPGKATGSIAVGQFLDDGWPDHGIDEHVARRYFADLGNQTIARFLQSRGLIGYQGSGRRMS